MAGAAPASRSGAVASPISLSDSRISEIPIRMRPVWRTAREPLLRKSAAPVTISAGVSHPRSSERIRTTSADPRSAPRRSARPVAVPSSPLTANPADRIATAVELWSSTAMIVPVPAARMRLSPMRRTNRRNAAPCARSTPVRTIRTAQMSSAAAPAMLRTTSGRFIGRGNVLSSGLDGRRASWALS